MANPHFDKFLVPNDADFILSLNRDFIYDNGFEVLLLPREEIVSDAVLNEPMKTVFKKAVKIDIFYDKSSSFIMPNTMIDFAGLSFGADNSTVYILKDDVKAKIGRLVEEGDLIYIEKLDKIFEIINLDARDPFISGGRYYTISCTIQPYKSSEGSTSFADTDTFEMMGAKEAIDLLTTVTDQENYLNGFTDFSSDFVTMDHNRHLINVYDDEERYTMDVSMRPNGSPDEVKDKARVMGERLVSANNSEIDCQKPGSPISDDSKNPFGFF